MDGKNEAATLRCTITKTVFGSSVSISAGGNALSFPLSLLSLNLTGLYAPASSFTMEIEIIVNGVYATTIN